MDRARGEWIGARAAGLAAALTALLILPHFLGEYANQILFRLLVGVILAEAWNLMAGYTGLVSLGTSSAVGLGGYVMVGMLNHPGLPLAAALAAAAAAGALLAAVAAPGLLRLRGLYFTVGTLALAEALRLWMVNSERFGGATGMFLARDPPGLTSLVRIVVGLLALTWFLLLAARNSRFWILLRAVRDDEAVAAQFGVRCFRLKLSVLAAASALMAAAGAVQALKLGAVEPYGSFGLNWSIDTLAMVIIGGLGQPFGAVIGAIVVVLSGELLGDYPEVHLALTGILLIVMTRFAPQGIAGLCAALWARLRGRRLSRT